MNYPIKAYTLGMALRCSLALGLLGGLAFADYLILDYQVKSAQHDAAQFNAAAQQRVLVERTALLARYLVNAPTAFEREKIRQQLAVAIRSLDRYHKGLIQGDPKLNIPKGPPPSRVYEIYFKPPTLLNSRLRNYSLMLRVLAKTRDSELTSRDSRLNFIRTVSSGKNLAALDAIVRAYQTESEAKIAKLQLLERWVVATTLSVLLGTGLFIFFPMVRRVKLQMKQLNETVVDLVRSNQELDRIDRELLEANARLEKLALLDPLTQLLNRRGLQQVLTVEIQRMRRDQTELHAILADLDDFKWINDTLGHAVGDVVLKEIALKLKNTLRGTDYVSRLGGDEFMILLPQTRRAEGLRVAEKTRLAISKGTVLLGNGEVVRVTASLGLVPVSGDMPSVDQLLVESHLALRKSKTTGKNRVSYSVLAGEELEEKREALPDFNLLLRQGNPFRAVRQPIFDLLEMRQIGYEFLSRSNVEGFEMPDDFFRISSESNLVSLVDHRCLKTCIEAGAALPAEVHRHLNLFPSTLLDIPAEHLLETIPEDNPKGAYCIEISEQQIIGDPSYLTESVQALKDSGVIVAIDDVGFGRSCLESLIFLEPQIVKIDKKCVNGISKDSSRVRPLKRLLKVAEDLGTEVIAEGIETQEDLEIVKELGVKYGQGFLLGRPA